MATTKQRIVLALFGAASLLAVGVWHFKANEGEPTPPPADSKAPVQSEPTSGVVTFGGETMGTTYTVKYVPPRPGMLGMAEVVVEGALVDVSASMSNYDPKSELSRLNQARAGQNFPVSSELMEVLLLSRHVHKMSGGAFDVTVGPLVHLYGFGAKPNSAPPEDDQVQSLRPHIGMQHLSLDPQARTVTKAKDEVELDLGAVAKGYGVDQCALALEKLGIKSYMVEVGGEIRARGIKPNGERWKLAILEPTPHEARLHGTLHLPKSGAAMATSGDYRNFRVVRGKTVSHIFDPRTLSPTPRRTASLSVVRPTAAEADALATAFSVLSPEEVLALADSQGIAVYMLLHDSKGGTEGSRGLKFLARQSRAWDQVAFELSKDSP